MPVTTNAYFDAWAIPYAIPCSFAATAIVISSLFSPRKTSVASISELSVCFL